MLRASVASRWDQILLPDVSISVPPRWGWGSLVYRIPRASAHGLTHFAPPALEPKLDQQPSFPTLPPKSKLPITQRCSLATRRETGGKNQLIAGNQRRVMARPAFWFGRISSPSRQCVLIICFAWRLEKQDDRPWSRRQFGLPAQR